MYVTKNIDIWLDLLNSDWHDYRGSGRREDRIDNPAWLARYISRWKESLSGISENEIKTALKNLRGILRGIVDCIASDKKTPEQLWLSLNAILASSPVVHRFDEKAEDYTMHLIPLADPLNFFLAEIAISFCDSLINGEPSRIKICDNKDCLWVFYDNSRNRSRRWCEGDTGCGNLMKVRRHRAKMKK